MQFANNKCEQIPPAASPAPISARQEDRISGGRHHSVGRPRRPSVSYLATERKQEKNEEQAKVAEEVVAGVSELTPNVNLCPPDPTAHSGFILGRSS